VKLSVYPYSLKPINNQINSVESYEQKMGCLLKFNQDDKVLYSDYHSGENFLDYNLFDLKNYFSKDQFKKIEGTDQWQQSVKLAKDMSASKAADLHINESHFLIQDVINFSPLDLLQKETNKFNRFKVKMGRSLRAETQALKILMEKSDYNTKFRLDFNQSIAKKEFVIWLNKNQDILQKKIEFIEDPLKWDSSGWLHLQNKFNISLALDMAANPLQLNPNELPNVLVLKPAKQNVDLIIEKHKLSEAQFVVTHYMDHPLGQLGANYCAQKLKYIFSERVLTGGLMGFESFHKHEFSEIRFSEQNFVPTKVFSKPHWGLGFIFDKLDWVSV